MHISDGVLSPYVVGIGWAIALPTLAVSVRRLQTDQVAAYGVVAAAFFACSTIYVPVGPFSMHLVLSGIAGLLLWWDNLDFGYFTLYNAIYDAHGAYAPRQISFFGPYPHCYRRRYHQFLAGAFSPES